MLTQPIGILGGMFDPVHFGHLRSAVELRQQLDLAQVRLIPCAKPPHRTPGVASAEQRAAMLSLAVADEPGLLVDEREIKRATPSYSVDTLRSLRSELPTTPLCLVVGMDAFLGFPTWHEWRDLFALCHVVVLERPGHFPEMPPVLAEEFAARHSVSRQCLREKKAGAILLQRVTQLSISSTALREALKRGQSVRYLLPDSVYSYITEHGLFRAN